MELLEIEKERGYKASSSHETTRVVDEEGMQRALVPSDRPYKRKDGTVEDPPWKEARATSVMAGGSMSLEEEAEEKAGSQRLHGVICGSPCTAWSKLTGGEKKLDENIRKEPWSRESFQCRPTGSDRWDTSLMEELDREDPSQNKEEKVSSATKFFAGGCKRTSRSWGDETLSGGQQDDDHPRPLDR